MFSTEFEIAGPSDGAVYEVRSLGRPAIAGSNPSRDTGMCLRLSLLFCVRLRFRLANEPISHIRNVNNI
jgi:hypothetical protein